MFTNRPDNVSKLDLKPGKDWTPEEISRVTRWWMEREQERLVRAAAYRYLGPYATTEDVEDAWVLFYAQERESSRKSYRPGGPDFATYALHVCFKRHCYRRAAALRKHCCGSTSLQAAAVVSGRCDEEICDVDVSPHGLVERNILIAEVVRFLVQAPIPPQQRRAFELKHFEQMSNEEVAWELGAQVGTVKVWAHRAALRIQEHLREKGWAN